MSDQFDNIPDDFKHFRQWVVWRFEDVNSEKPTKVPYSPHRHERASVTDPSNWGSFDQCAYLVRNTEDYAGLGFVLTDNDPFAFIDLDDTKGDQEAHQKQLDIFNESTSYAEYSPSGKGLHILLRGSIPHGRRRGSIEVYSSLRYMTMTGDIMRNSPVCDEHDLLNLVYEKLGKGKSAALYFAGLEEAEESDEEVYERAVKAQNGEKFLDLYNGHWEHHYPSPSEADLALVDILAFYSHNKPQISRMFLASELGRRDKAKRPDYVGYMLNKCFDRMLPPVDLDGLNNQLREAIEARKRAEMQNLVEINDRVENTGEDIVDPGKYLPPPGLLGEIAQFIYRQSPRPIPEIALAGAIGLMSGIVGRSFNVSNTGLNQYVMLLAPTGIGKEAMARGSDKLINACSAKVPACREFIGPSSIASAPALLKYMAKGPKSFVSVVGEFGLYLQQLGAENAAPHMKELRKLFLDLYNKSGQGSIMRQSVYADSDKNTIEFEAPGFSILGESTLEKFYEGLHEGLFSEGLLPRFTMIEYTGKKPPYNADHARVIPNAALIERLETLFTISLSLNNQSMASTVGFTEEAQAICDEYEVQCTNNENETDRDVVRSIYSRCHVKLMKLAALVAVGQNPYKPVIDKDVLLWAQRIVDDDARALLKKFQTGEIGNDNDEHKQVTLAHDAIRTYITSPYSKVSSYAGAKGAGMHAENVIPYTYLHRKLSNLAPFRRDRLGGTGALKRVLAILEDRGDLTALNAVTMSQTFKTTSKGFAIVNPEVFLNTK